MDTTREIVDAGSVGIALAVLSGVGLAAGVVLLGVSRKSASAKRAGLIVICLVLVFPMWLVYNAIEDRLGLDSVAGLLTNLVLFVVLGLGVGLTLRRLWPTEAAVRQGDMDSG